MSFKDGSGDGVIMKGEKLIYLPSSKIFTLPLFEII
jgi:hypothetical protein